MPAKGRAMIFFMVDQITELYSDYINYEKISKKNKAAFMLLLICNLVVAVLAFT
jgi:hypothetical protein